MTTQQANAQQIEYWNEVSGPKWVALADTIDAQIAPIGRAAMDRAGVAPGERVLDVGCGCGHTTLLLAERVGAEGAVVGIDISKPMLEDAERRRAERGAANVRFTVADAQTHALDESAVDLVFSRFGVMFFEDPAAAFGNLAGALRPGGRVTFACWQELGRNPWMAVPAMAAAKHVTLTPPADPHAPGPFAFADAERVRGLLESAGLEDVACEPCEPKLTVGGGMEMDRVIEFLMQMGPAGAAVREAGEDVAAAVRASMRDVLEPYHDGTGLVMDAAAWLVSARRPG